MTSYRDAGVDLEAGDRHVESIALSVTSTWKDEIVGGFGGFAAGVRIPPGYTDPILMMTTDGVGTKLDIARRVGRWDGVGYDLVAMCVDDLAAAGARPIGFVDYIAVGAVHPDRDRTIVESIAAACLQTGCPLLGGETAEHPGVMESDAVDLAGAVTGIVEASEMLAPEQVREGDAVVGLASPNLRSNGFSLVRSVFGDEVVDHADLFLEPSVIYAPVVLEAVASGGVHAAAHITGGGLASNLGRALPEGLGASIDMTAWERPRVFDMVAERGVSEEDMRRTFNLGIGFCLVVDEGSVAGVLEATSVRSPSVIGTVQTGEGVVLG
ncbi:MAG TPA: phosphoribosylformylglycinamidine cyclo-ligase [Acidimicrobiia bacterium]|nr:phosphoribosylformylglycinamidine cyclo-ligase [Acidimicrobiia bacterium]